jgi:nucleoside-diphosphate-sugar epimerase/RimJ/RimL family protein N-acetyltransferase
MKITLRDITQDDLEFLMRIRNQQTKVLRQNKPLTMENQQQWYINTVLESYDSENPSTKQFMIIDEESCLGYGGLCYIDYINQRAELSFLLDPQVTIEGDEYYSQILKEFVHKIVHIAFDQLKLHRIYAETYQYRKAHLKAIEEAGFTYEGTLREHFQKDGQLHNSLIHSIINKRDRILITGGAGLIGTELILELASQLIQPYILCVDLKPIPEIFKTITNLEYISMDFNDIDSKTIIDFNPNYIYHLAATFERSTETEEFLEENFHHNLKLGEHLSKIMLQLNNPFRLVFTSSYLIYDYNLYSHNLKTLDEQSSIAPRNICGASKFYHEIEFAKIGEMINKKTPNHFSMISPRIFRVYGPDNCGRFGGTIINRWINQLLDNPKSTIVLHRPNNQFDYIFSKDISRELIQLANSSHNGIVNLGSGHSVAVREVVNTLKEEFPEMEVEIIPDEKSPYQSEYHQSSTKLLNQIINRREPVRIRDGIRICIQEIKSKREK